MTNSADRTPHQNSVPPNVPLESKLPFFRSLLSFPAILKIVCSIFELCGFICALCSKVNSGVVHFFYIIMLVALLSTVLWFLLYLIQRNRKSQAIFMLKVEMYYHATGSLILLVASAIILGHSLQIVTIASIFGFLTTVGYVIETLFNYWKTKRISRDSEVNQILQS